MTGPNEAVDPEPDVDGDVAIDAFKAPFKAQNKSKFPFTIFVVGLFQFRTVSKLSS